MNILLFLLNNSLFIKYAKNSYFFAVSFNILAEIVVLATPPIMVFFNKLFAAEIQLTSFTLLFLIDIKHFHSLLWKSFLIYHIE